jgi:hypothetical protein
MVGMAGAHWRHASIENMTECNNPGKGSAMARQLATAALADVLIGIIMSACFPTGIHKDCQAESS